MLNVTDLELLLEAQNKLLTDLKVTVKQHEDINSGLTKKLNLCTHERIETQLNNYKLQSRVKIALSNPELVLEYDDIYIDTSRWNTERYCSSHVNSLCSEVEIRHICGCCSDSPIEVEVWPYIVNNNDIRIYSDPPGFIVGNGNFYGKEIPYDDWKVKLKDNNISDIVINKVTVWFNEHSENIFSDSDDPDTTSKDTSNG